VAAALATAARSTGLRVAARKPAQSYAEGEGTVDSEVLAAATGEGSHDVCLPARSYALPLAPFMAAERLGRPPFMLADLVTELRWPDGVDLGIVEAAGGVRSPISSDGGDTIDLIDALVPDDVVVVADAGLGTLNAVRLCVDALAGRPVTVVLNRFDGGDALHVANHRWLVEHLDVPVITEVAALLH